MKSIMVIHVALQFWPILHFFLVFSALWHSLKKAQIKLEMGGRVISEIR